jgi:hypothetical protein
VIRFRSLRRSRRCRRWSDPYHSTDMRRLRRTRGS